MTKARPIILDWAAIRGLLTGTVTQLSTQLRTVRPGDQLWVRETWQLLQYFKDWESGDCEWEAVHPIPKIPHKQYHVVYQATDAFADLNREDRGFGWRPSVHMPRWASRLLLEVVTVGFDPAPADSAATIEVRRLLPVANCAPIGKLTPLTNPRPHPELLRFSMVVGKIPAVDNNIVDVTLRLWMTFCGHTNIQMCQALPVTIESVNTTLAILGLDASKYSYTDHLPKLIHDAVGYKPVTSDPDFPHRCPKCGQPAYVGFNSIDHASGSCQRP